jgi:hypothetical protein
MANTFGLLCFSVGGKPWAPPGSAPIPGDRTWLPEIHLNIWERKVGSTQSAFLDIGLMLDLNEPAKSIELIFPWKVAETDITDLSQQIAKQDAIPAIFNESWTISHHQRDCIVSDPAGRGPNFAIVSTDGALTSRKHQVHDAVSIDIEKLKAAAAGAGKHVGTLAQKMYVRMRISNVERDFYCVGAGQPKERGLSPSWQRTEVIDFRLNVRRGAPSGLEHSIGSFTEFSKVHLFLMRSREQDIVFHDNLFKASRSLEDENFWASYSLTGSATKEEIQSNLGQVKQSLGYHWTKKAEPVSEFGTLARFKVVEFGIGKFVALALLLGALGNASWDGLKAIYTAVRPDGPVQAVCTNLPETSVVSPRADCAAPAKNETGKGPQRAGTPSNKQ